MACHLQIDADPDPAYHFDADTDPDPANYFDAYADPDPTFLFDEDPDPSYQIKDQNLEKSAQIGSYSIHFGFSSGNRCGSGSGSSLSL